MKINQEPYPLLSIATAILIFFVTLLLHQDIIKFIMLQGTLPETLYYPMERMVALLLCAGVAPFIFRPILAGGIPLFRPQDQRYRISDISSVITAGFAGALFSTLIALLIYTLYRKNAQIESTPDLVVIAGTTLLTPLVEEIFYRVTITGIMLQKGVLPLFALLIQAVLFGMAHYQPDNYFVAPGIAVVGLVFGIIYYYSGWLASVVAHSLYNGMILLLAVLIQS